MQMLEQEVVIGEHHPFERAVADDLHCTMKNSILRYFITHMLCTRPCTHAVHSAHWVWCLKREVGKSTWWVHSDLNLSSRRTQMSWFWNTNFISSLSFSRDVSVYLRFEADKTFSGAKPFFQSTQQAQLSLFFWCSLVTHIAVRPGSKGPPPCAASLWGSIPLICWVQLPTVLSTHKGKFKGSGRETWDRK